MSPASRHAWPILAALPAIRSIISRSPPAEKARPWPVITTTRVSASSSISFHTRLNSQCRRLLVALSTSGRLMVMSRIPSSRRSNSRCWYSSYFIAMPPEALAADFLSAAGAFPQSGRGVGAETDGTEMRSPYRAPPDTPRDRRVCARPRGLTPMGSGGHRRIQRQARRRGGRLHGRQEALLERFGRQIGARSQPRQGGLLEIARLEPRHV